jgi:5'-nucleotidase
LTHERALPTPTDGPRGPRPLAEWKTRPRILISNDDGIEAAGLLALRQSLEVLGDTYVMAPELNQSAVGHAKTLRRSLRIRERTLADGSTGSAVDGSPTDAVSVALLGYFGVSFDLVASGINEGGNLAEDVTYSGTVGAAIEAALNGVPALAISREWETEPDYELAGEVAQRAARNILEHGLGERELLNVNVPAVGADELEGIEIARMGRRIYTEYLIERTDPRGQPYYWFGGSPPSGRPEPGTDIDTVLNRRVSITPIHLDQTDYDEMERLRTWDWDSKPQESAEPVVSGSSGDDDRA